MNKWDKFFMSIARDAANLSRSQKKRVGAVAVKKGCLLEFSYNGTPPGTDNTCEHWDGAKWVTSDLVLHAEEHLIIKAGRRGVSLEGSSVYCTHQPCLPCARRLYAAGVVIVYYNHTHDDGEGIIWLQSQGVPCKHVPY